MNIQTSTTAWTIPGAAGEAILGNTHLPRQGQAIGVILLVHGFLGYKDYGFFPFLAQCAAQCGLVAHRFNLSNSGMTNEIATFARPDLFEKSTWRKTVFDIDAVVAAMGTGELPGGQLPYVLWGHSRGGVGVMLATGHRFIQNRLPLPAAVITVSAPSKACRMSTQQQDLLLTRGYLETLSGRTGQTLRIGRDWLSEQRDDPRWHDLQQAVSAIECPMLIVHGADDPTVDAADAAEIESFRQPTASTRRLMVPGADHVFKTTNPFGIDGKPSAQLKAMKDAVLRFATESVSL